MTQANIVLANQFNSNGIGATNGIALNQTILNGGTLQDYRASLIKANATTLTKDAWIELDTAIMQAAKQPLNAVADLQANNLIKRLTGGLGVLISQYQRSAGDFTAQVNMSPIALAENNKMGYDIVGVPIPIVQSDFSLDIRALRASQNAGQALDTEQAMEAAYQVAYASEKMLFNGVDFKLAGNSIYGYTTHPSRITDTVSDFGTIANIYTGIRKMIKLANDQYFYGPFVIYMPNDQYSEMLEVYSDGSGQSALQRVKQQFPEIRDIKRSYFLTSGNIVMVQMTANVVDLALAEDIQTVEWNGMGGLMSHFKVMAAWAPRIKADGNGRCGIVHVTGA